MILGNVKRGMSAKAGIRMKNPAHPGGFVRSEIVQTLDLSVTDAAKALGVARPALSALLNERAALSPEMALRIEKAFGVSMDTLMRMQNSYDIAQARRRQRNQGRKVYRQTRRPEPGAHLKQRDHRNQSNLRRLASSPHHRGLRRSPVIAPAPCAD